MIYIFELNHPKHYYQFKYIMQALKAEGYETVVLARDKDVLLKVLQEENVPYIIFGAHRKTLLEKILATPRLLINYWRIARSVKADVIISKASFYGCIIAKMTGAKSVIFPDSEVVKVTNRYVVPLATRIVTPGSFGLDYGKRHVRIGGLFEDCYLAPSVFTPDKRIPAEYGMQQPYAVLRFVGWYANHDVRNSGFTFEQKKALIAAIEPHMKVYISSEKPLPTELQRYQLPTPANAIHSVLAYADLYLGDSQTMATEAALLGTPAIRSNSFVGPNDMTNFKVLEERYGLLYNIRDFEDVLTKVKDMAAHSHKAEWQKKQQAYFAQVGDANEQIREVIGDWKL
ncbi:MAG: DUF354 domain-containing protein [Paludibacteraceae bacterium]|nr:DUF354 domain-containing protein [Paludibacteraceae bacterium]